jgi:hypothetical protein
MFGSGEPCSQCWYGRCPASGAQFLGKKNYERRAQNPNLEREGVPFRGAKASGTASSRSALECFGADLGDAVLFGTRDEFGDRMRQWSILFGSKH